MNMQKIRNKKGFTLAEVLLVVAIIVVLLALLLLLFDRRSMTKRQYDDYAKTLFIAAQNHLSMAESMNYLGRTDFGTDDPNEEGVAYFIANLDSDPNSLMNVLNLMLPFGSVDDTLRLGGTYLIRYQKSTGQILDVFY